MLAIVNSGVANISSVMFAFERIGANPVLTDDPKLLRKADKIVLPGVGAAKSAMDNLNAKGLVDTIKSLENPVLGICLGMQILFKNSQEGNVDCLSLIDGNIKHIPEKTGFTIPHMGWNQLNIIDDKNPLFNNIDNGSNVYFVHSYYAPVTDDTIASTDYIVPITASVKRGNFYGCQFHPEKSGDIGAKILKNFIEL